MQKYNNPDGKWSENIPYMIINLEHDRDIYLGKDTIVAYARAEDKSCDYLEINEIIELVDLKKDLSTSCTPMQASMDGQEYSPKVTHQLSMENPSPWTTPCHMSVDCFMAVN